MKYPVSVKPICDKCRLIIRKGRRRIICSVKRHNQAQYIHTINKY